MTDEKKTVYGPQQMLIPDWIEVEKWHVQYGIPPMSIEKMYGISEKDKEIILEMRKPKEKSLPDAQYFNKVFGDVTKVNKYSRHLKCIDGLFVQKTTGFPNYYGELANTNKAEARVLPIKHVKLPKDWHVFTSEVPSLKPLEEEVRGIQFGLTYSGIPRKLATAFMTGINENGEGALKRSLAKHGSFSKGYYIKNIAWSLEHHKDDGVNSEEGTSHFHVYLGMNRRLQRQGVGALDTFNLVFVHPDIRLHRPNIIKMRTQKEGNNGIGYCCKDGDYVVSDAIKPIMDEAVKNREGQLTMREIYRTAEKYGAKKALYDLKQANTDYYFANVKKLGPIFEALYQLEFDRNYHLSTPYKDSDFRLTPELRGIKYAIELGTRGIIKNLPSFVLLGDSDAGKSAFILHCLKPAIEQGWVLICSCIDGLMDFDPAIHRLILMEDVNFRSGGAIRISFDTLKQLMGTEAPFQMRILYHVFKKPKGIPVIVTGNRESLPIEFGGGINLETVGQFRNESDDKPADFDTDSCTPKFIIKRRFLVKVPNGTLKPGRAKYYATQPGALINPLNIEGPDRYNIREHYRKIPKANRHVNMLELRDFFIDKLEKKFGEAEPELDKGTPPPVPSGSPTRPSSPKRKTPEHDELPPMWNPAGEQLPEDGKKPNKSEKDKGWGRNGFEFVEK